MQHGLKGRHPLVRGHIWDLNYDSRKLAQSGIYQTFLYAYAFRHAEVRTPAALILYPSDGLGARSTHLQIRDGRGSAQAELYAYGLDIHRVLDGLWLEGDLDWLRSMVWGVLAGS